MPVTGTVPTIQKLIQGISTIDGYVSMLEDGDNRWVYMRQGDILYLNTENCEIIIHR